MINRNLGTAAVLLALFGLAFGLAGCGADTTTDSASNSSGDAFVADANSFDDLAKLSQMLEIEMEALTEPEVHRGGGSEIATVYWPQRDVTLDGLQTFRIDVGEEYEDNGKLEFRKGTKVLYSQPFEPEGTVTVAAIPQSVIDALKSGSTVKWGIFFDKKNKRDNVTGKFKVVKNTKVNRRLKKLESSKYFLRQDAMTREMMKSQVFQNTKLYSEALVQYLGILNYWPDVVTPYKNIVETCRRLDLTETSLYAIAADQVRGQGNLGRGNIRPGLQSPARAGARNGFINPSKGAPRVPETTAPPLQQRTSDGPKPLGTGSGVTPPAQDFDQPEGPDSTEPGTSPETGGPDRQGEREEWNAISRQLQDEAERAETILNNLNQGIEAYDAATQDIDAHQEQVNQLDSQISDAESRVQAAQAILDDPGSTDAQRDAAAQELQQAEGTLNDLNNRRNEQNDALLMAQQRQQQAQDALGMPVDEARAQAEAAEGWAKEARQASDEFARQYEMHFADPKQQEGFRELGRRAEITAQKAEARNTYLEAQAEGNAALETVRQSEEALATIQETITGIIEGGGTPTAEQNDQLEAAQASLLNAEQLLHGAESAIRAAEARLEELGVDPNDPFQDGEIEGDG